jgi:cytochrome c5
MTTANNKEFSISIGLVIGLLLAVGLIYLFVFSMAEDGFGKNMERVKNGGAGAVEQRIRPVTSLDQLLGDEPAGAVAVVAAKSPVDLYNGVCMACHAAGVAGAPKLGDKAVWEPRMAQGLDGLVASAIQGKGVMPPKGGSSYSDEEMRSVIEYMLAESGF